MSKPEETISPRRPSLEGRVAIVTGSGRNIGRAIALEFARLGADVVINGHRDSSSVERVAEEARSLGVRASGVMADVGNAPEIEALVATTVEELGGVDIVVSNVGVRHHAPLLDISPDEWDSALRSNLSAAFYLARCALPHMKARGWGRIIHISGRDGFFVKANRAHNVTAKAGLHALAKAIALEFGPHGVTANTVAPGIVDTERDLSQYPDFDQILNERIPSLPARRAGTVDDIAAICAFLCSDGASYVTGQLVHANGGEFMY